MTDDDEDERPTCPICGDETYGRPCETSYCAGHRVGHRRGYEAGHEDAGLAAIARASVAYEAGYAACRETMTPAVLATEDAYLLGHEAGRLAAIRAEVERAMPGMAAHASRLLRDGLVDLQEARREKPGGYRFLLIQDAEGKIATAWLFAAEAADCRRWLEATR